MGSFRLDPHYVIGLIDGEGYFSVHVRIRHRNGREIPEVDTKFGIELREDEHEIIKRIHDHFDCGNMYLKHDRRKNFCNLWMFRVEHRTDLLNNIIPFLDNYPLQFNQKSKDFQLFKQIVLLAAAKAHWTKKGMEKIKKLVNRMHQKPRRDYTLAPDSNRGEDIVHASGNTRTTMNKVSVGESADGSPPF